MVSKTKHNFELKLCISLYKSNSPDFLENVAWFSITMIALLHYMNVIMFTIIPVMIQFQNTLWTIPLHRSTTPNNYHIALCLLFIVPQIQ